MAAYIPVPRDLTRVKTKVFFNLTKRQLLCFGAAALIGVPIFFLVKATGNVSLAALSMMIVMLPLFFLAMYEKDGQPLEVVVEHFIQTKFVRPKVRPYQTDNYYDALMRQYKLEKEVERIVFQKEATGKKHQNACKSESEAAARKLLWNGQRRTTVFRRLHSSPFPFRECSRMASAVSLTATTPRRFSFRTSTISWHSRKIRLPSSMSGAVS